MLKKQSKCPPLIRQLCMFLDNDQIIRCGGTLLLQNLQNFQFSTCQFPIHCLNCHRYTHLPLSWRREHHSDCTEASLLDTINTSVCRKAIETLRNLQQVNGKTLQSSKPSPFTVDFTGCRCLFGDVWQLAYFTCLFL